MTPKRFKPLRPNDREINIIVIMAVLLFCIFIALIFACGVGYAALGIAPGLMVIGWFSYRLAMRSSSSKRVKESGLQATGVATGVRVESDDDTGTCYFLEYEYLDRAGGKQYGQVTLASPAEFEEWKKRINDGQTAFTVLYDPQRPSQHDSIFNNKAIGSGPR